MKNIRMNINFNINNSLKLLTPFIYIGLFSFIFGFVLFIYLPKDGIDVFERNTYQLELKKYDFYKNIKNDNLIEMTEKTLTLDKYKLTAIYSTKTQGAISLTNKNNQSFILLIGEEIDGFILKSIYPNYVLFEKESKIFKIKMNEETKIENNKTENNFLLKRELLDNLIKNPQDLAKGIVINENEQNNKIDGFKIVDLEKESIFSEWGFFKGDIIKKINGNYLYSYQDIMNMYIKINELKSLKVEILRENKIMELSYEIY